MERQLYPDDTVTEEANPRKLGIIERTHEDIDTHLPFPGKTETWPLRCDKAVSRKIFKAFLRDGIPQKGLVLVRWQTDATLDLIPITKLKLLDRSLLIGDIVKRNVSDATSGVILNTFINCSLQPISDIVYKGSKTLKGILPSSYRAGSADIHEDRRPEILTDVPASELEYAETLTEDDLVIYKDWIGRIEDIHSNITLRLTDNCVVEIADELGERVDGSFGIICVGDVVKTKKGDLRTGHWIYGRYNPNTAPIGTVVSVRIIGADVAWIGQRLLSPTKQEPPITLEAEELESPEFQVYDRTKRPDQSLPSVKLCIKTLSNSSIDARISLRVRFRDLPAACLKYSRTSGTSRITRLDRKDNLGYDLNVFDTVSIHTNVSVQWQDLSITTEDSTNLVPDESIDDEHAVWPSEIAHSLDMHRVFPDMPGTEMPGRVGVIQSVNALERMARIKWGQDSHVHYSRDPDEEGGVATIVSHAFDSTNSTEEEVSLYDIEAPAALNVRRGDIVLITPGAPNLVNEQPSENEWLGEIVDTLLDGKLIVRLGAARIVRDVELSREYCLVALRSDGTDQTDNWENEGNSVISDINDEDEDMDDVYDDTDDSSDDIDWDDEERVEVRYEDEYGNPLDERDVEDEAWESDDDEDEEVDIKTTKATSLGPEPYEILDRQVPISHHFCNEPSTTTSMHVKRTHKEHKILRNPSTLPEGVFIRTWESRLDLLRVLLVGPTETPYANAPFVIDIYLPPGFPIEPPQAFFHSWPAHAYIGGIGRVNPNLYEDGKICLSILGTWDGNKNEGWTAARSTLLQVIVSLLGLVLVREPYFNEAGYETLIGSETSKRASALYSERISLRAKGFLITALSSLSPTRSDSVASGVETMENIIKYLYHSPQGPKLLDVMIRDVIGILRRSEEGGEPDGLALMSKGACIPFKRVLDRLQELRQ